MEASLACDEPLTNCFFIFFMEMLWVKDINQKDVPQTAAVSLGFTAQQ